MNPPVSSSEVADRANQLYWGSDGSVNQIADELDLSKGALYGLIRPLPAGLACPTCQEEVVYPNRTARDRGLYDCPACGWSGPGAVAVTTDAGGGVGLESPVGAWPGGSRAFWGSALLGSAAVLALLFWVRRR
jgi:hypothetical protein